MEGDEDVGDKKVERDSKRFHWQVDTMHQPSGTDFVAPYFPLALAVSSECPLPLNFDLWLLDHLCLPCELVATTEMTMLPSEEATSQGSQLQHQRGSSHLLPRMSAPGLVA